jgi:hypothetical protein
MKRFETREVVATDGRRSWVIWDTDRNGPADGAYAVPDMAKAVTAGANALLAAGGDPYVDWCWDDGRAWALTRHIAALRRYVQ